MSDLALTDETALLRAAPLQRLHLARRDLEWLPPSLKMVQWTIATTIWAALAGVTIATIALAKFHFYIYGKGIAMIAAGGYYAGDRAARLVLRRRLSKLARGEVALTRLAHEPDGELVHTRGRVRAEATLPGVLSGSPCVYRRLLLTIDEQRLIHEAAVDFTLVDSSGEFIRVQVAGARIVGRDPKPRPLDEATIAHLAALPLPAIALAALAKRQQRLARGKSAPSVSGAEWLLRDGDEVEIVGLKARVIDPTVQARLERDTPMRATVRSAAALPLLIAPAAARR